MSLAKIKITAYGPGGTVVVNSEDISSLLAGAQLVLDAAQTPQLVVRFKQPDVEFDGEGVVHIVSDTYDARAEIMRFLNSVDPSTLEARALELGDLDTGPGVSLLAALKELVQ